MIITDITSRVVTIPLLTTFRTTLRSIDAVENVLVTVHTDSDHRGYGGAAPAAVITGETIHSIQGGILHIREQLLGMDVDNSELLFNRLNSCIIGCLSAKAAIDMALYDLRAKSLDIPLYNLLGGSTQRVETDITISLDETTKMVKETNRRRDEGFTLFKIKVGGEPQVDIERLQQIHDALDGTCLIRIDANQGWTPKQAIGVSHELLRRGINIDLIEQPVAAKDHRGMRFVRRECPFPVFADESLFSPRDAMDLIEMEAIDGLNIKLMKSGGIFNALKIIAIAETANLPCMIGSMMECHASVTAAAHLAASKGIIGRFDLDAPLFCSTSPVAGGMSYSGSQVLLPETPGLGIEKFIDSGDNR